MKKTTNMLIVLLLVAGTAAVRASAANTVRFNSGVGVIPTGSANTTVRTVLAAGQIWVIQGLTAVVKDDGSIRVVGTGLLLASGNAVGTNANAKVFATLMCGGTDLNADGTNVQHNTSNTPGVALGPTGDFVIDEALSPAPPSTCESPVLLIRNAGNGGWFAAGLP
jgi:hypothetical protein